VILPHSCLKTTRVSRQLTALLNSRKDVKNDQLWRTVETWTGLTSGPANQWKQASVHWLLKEFDLWPFWSREVIGHVTVWFPIGHFLRGYDGPLESSPNGFGDSQWRMLRNGPRDLTNSKEKQRSLILVPIDFIYTTWWLSIVTFALERTV